MPKHAPADVRRVQLFAAAMELCAEKGYHAARVEDIAARAGLSKGSVYHHFRSKKELFLSLLEWSMDEFAGLLDLDADRGSVAATLRAVIAQLLTVYSPAVRQGMVEFCLLATRNPEFRIRMERHYRGLIDAGARLIEGGIERGELAANLDPRAAARSFLMGLDGMGLMLTMLGHPDEDGALLALADLILAGMAINNERGSR